MRVRGQREAHVVGQGGTEAAAAQQRPLGGFELAADRVALVGVEILHGRQLGQRELERAFAREQAFHLGVRQRLGRALEGEPQPHRRRDRA